MQPRSFIALVLLFSATAIAVSEYSLEQKSIWELFDEEFEPLYQKEIDRILHDKIWREAVGEYDKTAKLDLEQSQDRAQRTVAQDTNALPYPPGLELMGRGLDWVTGENKQQVVQFNQRFRRRYWSPYTNTTYSVADEVFILNTPEVRVNEQVDVFSSTTQFQSSKSREFGINLALHNDGVFSKSSETQRMRGLLAQLTSRVAVMERLYTFYIMNMLPPENIQLTDEVLEWLNVLPAYDSNSKAVYVKFFERFGTHVATSAIFGGSIKLEDAIETSLWVNPSAESIRKQSSTYFKWRTEPNQERRSEIQAGIDPVYKESHRASVNFVGGRSEGLDTTDWQQWIPTLKDYPAMLRTRMLPISEFVTDARLRSDLEQATRDYARDLLKSPAETGSPELAPEVVFADIVCNYRTIWIFWKTRTCRDPVTSHDVLVTKVRQGMTEEHVVDLKQLRRVFKMRATTSRSGENGQVWDFIRIYTAQQMTKASPFSPEVYDWEEFGTIGKDDGAPDITEQNHVLSFRLPRFVRYVKYQLVTLVAPSPGTQQSDFSLQVLGVEDSANQILGNLETALETRVVGWAVNSFGQSYDAVVRVYANGQQVGEGRPTIARTDVQQGLQLPSADRLGFDIPISLPGEGRFDVHVIFVGFNGATRESAHYTVWGFPPPGKLVRVTPGVVTGWAWNRFNAPELVTIEIWVNGALHTSGQTGIDFPVSRSAFNVDGNHGFRVPINIKGSGMFNVVAYAQINGQRRQLYNPVQLDLRYPRGVIEELTAARVVGWAIDPAHPDEDVEIAVFIDNVRVSNKRAPTKTTILRQEVNEAWNVLGNHGFNIPLRIQGGKVHEVAVYTVQANKELAFIAKKLVALNLEEFATSANAQNPLVNLLGAGFDAVYEEFRLPVIQFNYDDQRFMDNPYAGKFTEWALPDEVMINANAEVVIDESVQVFNTTRAYLDYRARTTGVSFGFYRRSRTTITVKSTLQSDYMRYVTYDRMYRMFDAILLPPCCGPNTLQMHQYAALQVAQLPPYNRNTKHMYLRFIQYFGTHYLHKATFGGQISMHQTVNSSQLEYSYETYIRRQSGFTFGFIISLSFSSARSEYSRHISKQFTEASQHEIRYIGGHPELFQIEESDEWSKSVKDNPALIQFELKELSEMVEDERRRADLHQAIVDYMDSSADVNDESVCPTQTNYAELSAGARVIWSSSVNPLRTQDTFDNLLRREKVPWSVHGYTGFLFADGDDLQQLIIDLGQLRFIRSISVQLTPAGHDRAVWDYIRVQVSVDNQVWSDWQLIGVPDGLVDITDSIYQMPVIQAQGIHYIQFTFGASGSMGSHVIEITATGCSE